MRKECGPSCFSCDDLDFKKRCPFDPDAPVALNPGDLDALFQRIMTEPKLAQYTPKAIMQPNPSDHTAKSKSNRCGIGIQAITQPNPSDHAAKSKSNTLRYPSNYTNESKANTQNGMRHGNIVRYRIVRNSGCQKLTKLGHWRCMNVPAYEW